MKLIDEIRKVSKTSVKTRIERRLKEFKSINSKSNKEWFSELCFCMLTANSKAATAINIQNELGYKGFSTLKQNQISAAIRRNKHRFHNNKAKFIVQAREFQNIRDIIKSIISQCDEKTAREWIASNIKGLGWKEASHFLRNVGYTNLAILDRHVINLMIESKMIKEKPKTLSGIHYLKLEQKLAKLCIELKMSQAELDMYLWYLKTNEVLK
ncbi:N-glycosylase/DNA lyase [Candidatus Woesearchaeota archaeon]|nr:N-glycosylase/DNA lyase [Candidatus Woesearchaeota archaeon]